MQRAILILGCLILSGCNTLPEAPHRDDELFRQSIKLQDNLAQKLVSSLKDTKAPPEQQNSVRAIYELCEANVEWIGHPDEEYSGDHTVLINKMRKNDELYNKNIEGWKEQILVYKATSKYNSIEFVFILLIILVVLVGFGVFIVKVIL